MQHCALGSFLFWQYHTEMWIRAWCIIYLLSFLLYYHLLLTENGHMDTCFPTIKRKESMCHDDRAAGGHSLRGQRGQWTWWGSGRGIPRIKHEGRLRGQVCFGLLLCVCLNVCMRFSGWGQFNCNFLHPAFFRQRRIFLCEDGTQRKKMKTLQE